MLTLKDLKEQGFTLSGEEARELQPSVQEAAMRSQDGGNIIYEEPVPEEEEAPEDVEPVNEAH